MPSTIATKLAAARAAIQALADEIADPEDVAVLNRTVGSPGVVRLRENVERAARSLDGSTGRANAQDEIAAVEDARRDG